MRSLAAADDRPLVERPVRLYVEPVAVDHPVLPAFRDGLVRVDLEQAQKVVQLDREQAAGPQRPKGLGQHLPVLVVAEVAERREPAEHAVEPLRPRKRPHVALDVLDLHAPLGCVLPSELEKQRRRIEARDPHTTLGERVRDPPVPAGEVEELESRLELEQLPDQLDLGGRPLRREQLLVEVEVVLVERLVARELGAHRRSLTARETVRQVAKARFRLWQRNRCIERHSCACSASSSRTSGRWSSPSCSPSAPRRPRSGWRT